jgi:hypothetical protein
MMIYYFTNFLHAFSVEYGRQWFELLSSEDEHQVVTDKPNAAELAKRLVLNGDYWPIISLDRTADADVDAPSYCLQMITGWLTFTTI